MPAFWWHEVRSQPDPVQHRNLAINYWYKPVWQKEFPCASCGLEWNHRDYPRLLDDLLAWSAAAARGSSKELQRQQEDVMDASETAFCDAALDAGERQPEAGPRQRAEQNATVSSRRGRQGVEPEPRCNDNGAELFLPLTL